MKHAHTFITVSLRGAARVPLGAKITNWMKGSFHRVVAAFATFAALAVASGASAWAANAPLWSLQPVANPPPPAVRQKDWPLRRVDHFILAELEKNGLAPSADADAPTMLRRLCFDLTGLPPSLAEIAEFEKLWARDPQGAIARTVDRLLASPDFGARWGRHWLDVARYAESSGNTRNMAYVLAWRYRNWVVEALNRNTPFNLFIREQLAGDLIPAATQRERDDHVLGTGFLTVGVKSLGEQDLLTYELNIADDQIDVTSRAFLGLTVSCARCHDHKFDPIPTRDYYALAGIFRSTAHFTGVETNNRREEAMGMALGNNARDKLTARAKHDARLAEMQKEYETVAKRRNAMRDELTKAGVQPAVLLAKKEAAPAETMAKVIELSGMDRSVDEWKAKLARMQASAPQPPPFGMATQEKAKPADSPLFDKGDPKKPLAAVPRGPLSAVRAPLFHAIPPQESGRRQLADWIASPGNPLAGRVIVNRVWLHLFGKGIVDTPDDFGTMGAQPTHPALLDHLAFRFVREGWDVKALIRELVTSRAYRMSSQATPLAARMDATNKLLSHANRKAIEAEAVRDALLALGGSLDHAPLQGSQVAVLSQAVQPQGRELGRRGFLSDLGDEPTRRSIYLPVVRGKANEAMQCFDCADPSLVTGQRRATIVPTQTLFLMNSDLVMQQSRNLAAHVLAIPDATLNDRIIAAWRMTLTRPPTTSEAQTLREYLSAKPDDADAWAQACQTLMLTGEFRTLE
jgi:Protein of unknown function (DUF1553)/Protein of unknown function (DUF1549)